MDNNSSIFERIKLQDLVCERVAVQCHNYPDADTLASGYGLYRFFKAKGVPTLKFFYCGRAVTKPNLTMMIEKLGIPIEHEPGIKEWDGLLITVDCQYRAGNLTKVAADRVAVIDHHVQDKECELPSLHDLRPSLGSCSTLVWDLLCDASFPIDVTLGTALYYGLFSDTDDFSELRHPLDHKMSQVLKVDQVILKDLKKSNLALSDVKMFSAGLNNLKYDMEGDVAFAIVSTPPCDRNLLGFISDFVIKVHSVDLALVHTNGKEEDMCYFSVRTALDEVKASELAEWISKDTGTGGGHRKKAGGKIFREKIEWSADDESPRLFFIEKVRSYLKSFEIIKYKEASTFLEVGPDANAMKNFRKRPVRLGYVFCHELFRKYFKEQSDHENKQVELQISMLEGDVDISASEETVLMIGTKKEIYPMEIDKFIQSYTLEDEKFTFDNSFPVTVLDKKSGRRLSLANFAKTCVSLSEDENVIRAMRLKGHIKLFVDWDIEGNYLRGDPGDWLVERSPDDHYIVKSDVFEEIYIQDCTGENIEKQGRAVRVVKKQSATVSVIFALESGVLETREGRVSYERGDALLTGSEGEAWPVRGETFFKTYSPASAGIKSGQDGAYRKNKVPVWAVQMDEPFMVKLSDNRGILRGKAWDWLLQYDTDDYGVLGRDIFEATYEIVKGFTP